MNIYKLELEPKKLEDYPKDTKAEIVVEYVGANSIASIETFFKKDYYIVSITMLKRGAQVI